MYCHRMQGASFLLFALLLTLLGCMKGAPSAQELAQKTQQEQADSQKLTDAQCEEFGRQFVTWIENGENAILDSSVDFARIMEKAADGISMSGRAYRGLTKGAMEGMKSTGLGKQFSAQSDQGAEFSLLRVKEQGGYKRAVIRNLPAGGGVNYHELLLTPGDGGVKVVDIYAHASGDLMSDTVRQMLIPMVAQSSSSAVKDDALAQSQKFKQMAEQAARQDYAGAMATYETLSPSFQKLKPARILYLSASSSVDEAKYAKALEEYRRDFPGDAAADMLSIDSHILAKRYDDALAACDKVDAAVGGDPYLHTIRGNILLAAERPDEAAKRAKEALAGDPKLKKHVDILLADIALTKKDYSGLAGALTALEAEHGLDMSAVKTEENYAEFRKSTPYQQWLKQRK